MDENETPTEGEAVDNALLDMQENLAPMVAAWTGIKVQFLEQGWSEPAAEMMTAHMFVVCQS